MCVCHAIIPCITEAAENPQPDIVSCKRVRVFAYLQGLNPDAASRPGSAPKSSVLFAAYQERKTVDGALYYQKVRRENKVLSVFTKRQCSYFSVLFFAWGKQKHGCRKLLFLLVWLCQWKEGNLVKTCSFSSTITYKSDFVSGRKVAISSTDQEL